MKKIILITLTLLTSATAFSAGDKAPIDVIEDIIREPGRPDRPGRPGDGDDHGNPNQWACSSVNTSTQRHYLTTGRGEANVSAKALNTCLDNTYYPRQCADSKCERDNGRGNFRVQTQNSSTRKIYSGKGSTRLEAQANAMNSCVSATYYPRQCGFYR